MSDDENLLLLRETETLVWEDAQVRVRDLEAALQQIADGEGKTSLQLIRIARAALEPQPDLPTEEPAPAEEIPPP